jgi:hypothetical protein
MLGRRWRRTKPVHTSFVLHLFPHFCYTVVSGLEMFAAASSFFSRTNISANYTIGGSGPSPSPRPGASPTPAAPAAAQSINLPHAPTFKVGPWRVQSAAHKTSGKRVSVWDLDKRNPWLERLNPAARDRALEVLKAEVCLQPYLISFVN